MSEDLTFPVGLLVVVGRRGRVVAYGGASSVCCDACARGSEKGERERKTASELEVRVCGWRCDGVIDTHLESTQGTHR